MTRFASFIHSRALTGITATAVAVMAPIPAFANASADIVVPVFAESVSEAGAVKDSAGVAAGDRKFRNLFASWKALDNPAKQAQGISPGITPVPAVSIPSRLPVKAARYSSNFGMRIHPVTGKRRMHQGIDIAAPTGTPIYASADGTVEMAKWNGGYGLYVQLAHGGDMETRYGHMSRLNVSAGQRVLKGELIGFVGSTGRSTGPHLHYEVRIAGKAVNPEPYLSPGDGEEAFAQAMAVRAAGGPE